MENIINYFMNLAFSFGEKAVSCILLLIVGFYLSKQATKIIVKILNRANVDHTLVTFMRSLTSTALKGIVFISALGVLGFPSTSIIAVFTTVGAALALGFKDNLGNFVSGIIVLFTKPFVIGDYIEIDNFAGTVKEIQMMVTILNTPDNKRIVVPNNELTTSVIVNNTHETYRRLDLFFDIEYESDVELTKQVILDVVNNHEATLSDFDPVVRVNDYANSSIQIISRSWCDTEAYFNYRFDLLEQIKRALDDNNIKIPFNQLDINIKQKDC